MIAVKGSVVRVVIVFAAHSLCCLIFDTDFCIVLLRTSGKVAFTRRILNRKFVQRKLQIIKYGFDFLMKHLEIILNRAIFC